MHLSTLFRVSIAFVLADMSTALPIGRENMLVARFGDSNLLEARVYDRGSNLYARGSVTSHIPRVSRRNRGRQPSQNTQTVSSEGDTPVIHIHSHAWASSSATSSMIVNPPSSRSISDHSTASVGLNPSVESIGSHQSGNTGSLIVHPPDSRNQSPERAPIALQHPDLHNQSPSTTRKLRVSTAELGQYDNLRTPTALHPSQLHHESQERTPIASQPPHSHNEAPATIAHPSRERTGSTAGSDLSGTTAVSSVSSENSRVSSPHRRSLYEAF